MRKEVKKKWEKGRKRGEKGKKGKKGEKKEKEGKRKKKKKNRDRYAKKDEEFAVTIFGSFFKSGMGRLLKSMKQ